MPQKPQMQSALLGQQKLWVPQSIGWEFFGQVRAEAGEMARVAVTAARANTKRASFLRMDNLLAA